MELIYRSRQSHGLDRFGYLQAIFAEPESVRYCL